MRIHLFDRLPAAALAAALVALSSCGGHSAWSSALHPQTGGAIRHVSTADAYEPDDSFATATAITPDATVQTQARSIDPGADSDWVSFNAVAGTTYYFWSSSGIDTYANLYDSTSTFVVLSDDDGEDFNFFLTFTSPDTATYKLQLLAADTPITGDYDFHFASSTVASADSFENDDSSAAAQAIDPTAAAVHQAHNFAPGGDADWFTFTGDSSKTYHITSTQGFDDGTVWVIPAIRVYDITLTEIAADQGSASGGVNFLLDFTPPVSDIYYIEVYDAGPAVAGGPSLTEPFGFHCATDLEPAPTGVTATDGTFTGRVDISWTPGGGPAALYYDVLRSDHGGPFNVIHTSTDTVHRDFTNTDSVTPAQYAVVAHSASGESWMSTPNSGFPSMSAPNNVAATDGVYTSFIRVSWTAAPGASYYQVFRSATAGGTYSLIGSTTDTQYNDPRPTTVQFWYKVRSGVGGTGYSAYSPADVGHDYLAAPTSVAATDGTYTDHVRVSWISVAGASYYQVLRATALAGPYSVAGTTSATQFDDSRQSSAVYWYKVRSAIGFAGYSDYSNADAGNSSLSAPTGVAATDGTLPYVHVTWNAVGGATHYQVYRATTLGGTYTAVGGSTSAAFNDHPADSATYYYKVKSAVTATGYSALSDGDAGSKS